MSRIYVMTQDSSSVIEQLKAGKIAGCTHVYQPLTDEGAKSLWSDGIRDQSGNAAWFEANMLLVWGSFNETAIRTALRSAGISTRYLG